MTPHKIVFQTRLYIILFAALLTSCTSSSLYILKPTITVRPTAMIVGSPASSTKTAVISPADFVTETLVAAPTSIPSPSPTPAYSYLPPISEANATEIVNFDQFDGGVNSIAISPNGKYLAAAFNNGVGVIWDISAAKSWPDWHEAPKKLFIAKGTVSINPDNSVMATGGSLIDLSSMKIIQELPGTVTFSPSEKTLALAERDAVSIWNFNGEQWVLDYKQNDKFVASLTFSPDGNLLGEALEWGGGEGVNILRISDHKLLYSFPPSEHGHGAHFNFETYAFVAFSPDNQFVATGTKDEPAIRLWNLQSGELIKDFGVVLKKTNSFSAVYPNIKCAFFTQDVKVIVQSGDETIYFRKVPDGELLGVLEIDPYGLSRGSYITACAISNDGKLLVVGESGGEVSIWGVPAPVP